MEFVPGTGHSEEFLGLALLSQGAFVVFVDVCSVISVVHTLDYPVIWCFFCSLSDHKLEIVNSRTALYLSAVLFA